MGRDRRFLDASGRRLRVAGGGYTAAKEAAEKALELEPELAEAHTARGKVLGWYEWKFAEGELALRRAVAANPNYAGAHWGLGSLLPTTGHMKEGLQEVRTAQMLDPLSPVTSYWHARYLLYAAGGGRDRRKPPGAQPGS